MNSEVNKSAQSDKQNNLSEALCPTVKKPYETPVLICHGDVRDITLGPTFGAGESGCEVIRRVGPGGCP